MAEDKTFPMTLEGKTKIEAELNKLITETRAEITNRIQIARSFGDLSENSEYQSAKDEQAFVEGRINTLQNMLDNAVMIDSSEIAADEVAMGKVVTFQELPDEEPETYEIVGAVEADPLAGKISNESPIAQSLIGKSVGDAVTVNLPNNGSIEVKILSVKNA
ncbi:transcription elongation factor GreA [Weissella muntiaci]|uniref:Transcription elongation factor GreA n=1 Tax=Weissella muntiaci TaxID=2508881 RepID=A0A6C2C3E2_9LACO|nr:transcription elongation factor GreA [Weissella muntiaci]TYC48404.1 transcription elongation factor GreA [Weissella muntiaci]